ncbi:MAG TPA: dicarboxylate/amino acid:cation symporter [Campylobacterales bacterium]|nr:dicarboxylate/amino acid:cation symporter [Campylobacterales bacterium]
MKYLKDMNVQVIIAIILGIVVGLYIPAIATSLKFIGVVFVNLLKMLVVPLIFASIFTAIAGLGGIEKLKKKGVKTLFFYILTTAFATFLAIVAMNLFPIGEPTTAAGLVYEKAAAIKPFSLESMLVSFIPTNIFNSLTSGSMMQIIVFSILLAVSSLYLENHQQDTLYNFFWAISNAMLEMSKWIIKLTPIGLFSLISFVVADQGVDILINLWKYIFMVLGVLLVHLLATLPSLLFIVKKINPYNYLNRVKDAILMAFSTASSAATLPVSLKTVVEKGGVSKESANFVLPLGATVSMDGTAAYLTVAVLYIANLAGVDMSFSQQLILGLTVVMLSIGVAALPSASLVMMVVILNELGLPTEYIAIIVSVDRILDMARTSVNVTSDLVVTKMVDEK